MSGNQHTKKNKSNGKVPSFAVSCINEAPKQREVYERQQQRPFDTKGSKGSKGLGRSSLSLLHDFDNIVQHTDIPQFLIKHKATLRFPETLFLLLAQAEREAVKKGRAPDHGCISWTLNGTVLIIRNQEELINELLPLAFCRAKISSFIRKLYRWGFRQAIGQSFEQLCETGEKAYWHPEFQRENKPLAMGMKSTTAEGKRRAFSQLLIERQESRPSELLANPCSASSSDRRHQTNQDDTPGATTLAVQAPRCTEHEVIGPLTALLTRHHERDLLTSLPIIPHVALPWLTMQTNTDWVTTALDRSSGMTERCIMTTTPTAQQHFATTNATISAWSQNQLLDNYQLVQLALGVQQLQALSTNANSAETLRAVLEGFLPVNLSLRR